MKRRIDEVKMNQAKERTMELVMNTITKKPRFSFRIPRLRVAIASMTLFVIALVVMLNTPNPINPDQDIVINAYESEKIAEISYLTSSLIGSSIQVSDPYLMKLGYTFLTEETTSFEDNDEQINLYFDILKVFLEEDVLDSDVIVTVSEENPKAQMIEFSIEGIAYVLEVEFLETNFTGTLSLNGIEYQVEGVYEEEGQELKFNMKAVSGDNYVQIDFKTENKDDETEVKYEIQQRYQGVESSKEVKVSNEQNEQKVVIKEENNEYTLKKETEDNGIKYKLEYRIDEVEGEAVITETIDSQGNVQYNYSINENGITKQIEHGKPERDNNPGNNNSGNGNPNDENNGNGNGNNGDTGKPENPGNPNTSLISDL